MPLHLDCPRCAAVAGVPCVTPPDARYTHAARLRARTTSEEDKKMPTVTFRAKIDARATECPDCAAPIGMACLSPYGKERPGHATRLQKGRSDLAAVLKERLEGYVGRIEVVEEK